MLVRLVDIAQNERRLLEPAGNDERAQIRDKVEIAVTLLPVRKTVARDRLHLHVGRQEVVASVGSLRGRFLDEHFSIASFAEQAPVMIGEAHDDRLDHAAAHEIAEFVERQASALSRCDITHTISLLAIGELASW